MRTTPHVWAWPTRGWCQRAEATNQRAWCATKDLPISVVADPFRRPQYLMRPPSTISKAATSDAERHRMARAMPKQTICLLNTANNDVSKTLHKER